MSEMYGRIEELCRARGITIGKMCAELGVSRGTMGDLNAGRTKKLSADNVSKIAAYFSVSADFILTGEQNEKSPACLAEDDEMVGILQDFRDNPDLRTLFSLSRNATPEELRQYANVIRALRGNRD